MCILHTFPFKVIGNDIPQLISEERLQSHAQTDEDIMKLSERIWKRDTDRLLEEQLRAKALPQLHAGVLTMHAPCKGLGAANDCTKSAEILDLLEYLVSRICCFKPAYAKFLGKLVDPMVSHPCQWHCSPPQNPWIAWVSPDGTHDPMTSMEPTTTAPTTMGLDCVPASMSVCTSDHPSVTWNSDVHLLP